MSGHACAVLAMSPDGALIMVRDPNREDPLWKLPGGRSEQGERAEDTALRELAEETGICLEYGRLELIHRENRGNHLFFMYFVEATEEEMEGLVEQGEEGEEVSLISTDYFLLGRDVHPAHRTIALQEGMRRLLDEQSFEQAMLAQA